MHSEMQGCSMANTHRMRQPIRINLPCSLRGLVQGRPQEIVTRLGFYGDKLIHVVSFKLSLKPIRVNLFSLLYECVNISRRHCVSPTVGYLQAIVSLVRYGRQWRHSVRHPVGNEQLHPIQIWNRQLINQSQSNLSRQGSSLPVECSGSRGRRGGLRSWGRSGTPKDD